MTYDIAVFLIDRVRAAVMLLGDKEHMHGRHRIQVMDGDDLIILIHFV